ncbi:MAG: aldo/keto reductase [Gammaproteobacteria bacterium]|nr:aldo/keto reductase [Gammaproteobacteria bacterium]
MSTDTNLPNTPAANRRDFLRWSAAASALPFAAPAIGGEIVSPGEVKRYARLGRTGHEISDISFGSSSLRPGQENLVHLAMDRGINYFDTAESYTRGQSETVIGRALKGKRDQVVITSKIGTKADGKADAFMRRLEGSLRRLQTDYVDVYMNHAVNDVDVVANPEWHAFVAKAKEQGKMRFSGISGHAGRLVECLDYAFDNDLVDVVLVAHNFGQDPKFYEGLTKDFDFVANQQALPRVLAKGKAKNVGITVMKTLRGGRLNDMRPYETGDATFAQAALRWVLSNPHVDAAVITMNNEQKIEEYLGASGWREVAAGDRELLERYAHLNRESYCVNVCNDCEGACPYGVPIAEVLRTRMYAVDYQDTAQAKEEYALLATNAAACLLCSGEPCAQACTHGIPIDRLCGPTHRLLA